MIKFILKKELYLLIILQTLLLFVGFSGVLRREEWLMLIATSPIYFYCFIRIISIQEKEKKRKALLILSISGIAFTLLYYGDFFTHSYTGRDRVSRLRSANFWDKLGIGSREDIVYPIQSTIFTLIYAFIRNPKESLADSKSHKSHQKNSSLTLLINLKESGKLSAEDFYEEVKKLNEK